MNAPIAHCRRLVTVMTAALVASVAGTAEAAPQIHTYRIPNNFEFYIDTASFVRNTVAISTEDDAERWVLFALNQWLRHSRLNINVVYKGRHAVGVPAPNSWADNLGDGFSTIFMTDNYTGAWGETPPLCAGGPCGSELVVEQDMIIWHEAGTLIGDNGPVGWEWTTYPNRATSTNCTSDDYYARDLIETLTHEFGHFLGVAHASDSDPTVMRNTLNTPYCGSTFRRHPTVSDLKALEMAWAPNRFAGDSGASSRSYTLEWATAGANGIPGTSFNDVSTWITSDRPGFDVAFAKQSSSQWASIATSMRKDWTSVRVHRLPTGESWLRKSMSDVDITFPPGIAGKTEGSDRWVIAGARYQETMTCSTVRTWRTTNNFSSKSRTTLSDDCIFYSPSLTYHEGVDRFVMAYVRRSYAAGGALSGIGAGDSHIILRSSTDGATWTAPYDIGVLSSSRAEVACDSSKCVLEWTSADTSYPYLVQQEFTMDSNGNVTFGTLGWSASFWADVGNLVRRQSGWLHTGGWNSAPVYPFTGWTQSADQPLTVFASWNQWSSSQLAVPNVVSHIGLADGYFFRMR